MRAKISYKLIFAVGSVATVMIGIFAYVIVNSYQRQLIANLEMSADQLSATVIASTRYDMLLNRRQSVHQIINTIGRQEGIEKVRIFNKEGIIILSTDSLDVGKKVDLRAEACYACHAVDQPLERVSIANRLRIFDGEAGHRISGIITPIYNEASCWESSCHAHRPDQQVLGVLDITVSLESVDREQRDNIMRLLLMAVFVITAISIMIYLLAREIILKPIERLVTATRRVAGGDLTYTVPVKRKDEIGNLTASFNSMTKRLADSQLQLYQSDKLASAGRLAAGVAHEINNPLTGVLTYSSFLLNRAKDDPEMREDLEVIVRETKRCREIVKGLLDFSRQSKPEKHHINLNETIRKSVSILSNQFRMEKISIELELDESLPEVYADANQLQQLLVNLLENAADAMGESGGSITIETSRTDPDEGPDGENVRIRIRDTGSGIDKENLDKIFDPFFSTKGQQGNGLGLSIVWGIVEGHDGHISVESEVGVSTVFTILLPIDSK